MRVRRIVEAAIGTVIVVRVEQIVAPTAVHVILVGTTNQPVITEITEQTVVTVALYRTPGVIDLIDSLCRCGIEVENKRSSLGEGSASAVYDFIARVKFVVFGEFTG